MKSGSKEMTVLPIEWESLVKVFAQPHNPKNKISFKITDSAGKVIKASDPMSGTLTTTLTST